MNEKYDLCDIDESYLHTVSMTELFDSAYQSKPPIIDGLLYRGTYLFAGSPKIGKSFLMAQLAYHVSTGTNLGALMFGRVRYCISLWRTTIRDCKSGCIVCKEQPKTKTCSFRYQLISSAMAWTSSWTASYRSTQILHL